MPILETRILRSMLATLTLLGAVVSQSSADTVSIPTDVTRIDEFRVGSSDQIFGRLKFNGGLVVSSGHRYLGAMSAVRRLEDTDDFLGVMDTGRWFTGKLIRDKDGRLSDIGDFEITPMLDEDGNRGDDKSWGMDAEGLALAPQGAVVSFEKKHRINSYFGPDTVQAAVSGEIEPLIPRHEFRSNKGMETLLQSDPAGPLAGALVTISEKSLNKNGDIFAAVLDGPRKGIFAVKRVPPYDITDGDFLPNGDLLLLERRFNMAEGIGMRIRLIDGSHIKPGALLEGEELLQADFGNQIDNMEGLDVAVNSRGETTVLLVSDDNHSFLQRNLFLEFILLP